MKIEGKREIMNIEVRRFAPALHLTSFIPLRAPSSLPLLRFQLQPPAKPTQLVTFNFPLIRSPWAPSSTHLSIQFFSLLLLLHVFHYHGAQIDLFSCQAQYLSIPQ